MENKKIDHDDKLPIKFLISNFLFLTYVFSPIIFDIHY